MGIDTPTTIATISANLSPEAFLSDRKRLGEVLRTILPSTLPNCRWFAGKSRSLDSVEILDTGLFRESDPPSCLTLLRVSYADGGFEVYFLPLSLVPVTSEEATYFPGDLGTLELTTGVHRLRDATQVEPVWDAILTQMRQRGRIQCEDGEVLLEPEQALEPLVAQTTEPPIAQCKQLEQSNSAILFGQSLFLKVFRKLEVGLNLDLEVGRFLTRKTAFGHVPPTCGSMTYRCFASGPSNFGESTLAILQGWIPSRGTGWDEALRQLPDYFLAAAQAEVLGLTAAVLTPSNRSATLEPVQDQMRDWITAVGLLGQRTGEMHLALSGDATDPVFGPEPFTAMDLDALLNEVRQQVETATKMLQEKHHRLGPIEQNLAERLIAGTPNQLAHFDQLAGRDPHLLKIRVHGDYHLGQVLKTDLDFIILDFEGEPARSLAQRRAKRPAVRDVVGMLRSFSYAAYAGLFQHADRFPQDADRLAPWAELWERSSVEAFLAGYAHAVEDSRLTPDSEQSLEPELRWLLNLEKAYYELAYELNNRPAWVRIPLRGLVKLVEGA